MLPRNVESNDGAAPGAYSEPRTPKDGHDDDATMRAIVKSTFSPEELIGFCPLRGVGVSPLRRLNGS